MRNGDLGPEDHGVANRGGTGWGVGRRVSAPIAAALVIVAVTGAALAGCDASPAVAPTAPAATPTRPATTTPSPTRATARPSQTIGPAFTFSGSGTSTSKPFTVTLPGRVDYTFSGPGKFIASIDASDGSRVAEIADILGPYRATTWLYANHLTGRVRLNVIAVGTYTITVTSSDPAPSSALPASYSGIWGIGTTAFEASGDVRVKFTHEGGGVFSISLLDASDGSAEDDVARFVGHVSAATEVTDLAGTYAFDVTADGPWAIAVSPG